MENVLLAVNNAGLFANMNCFILTITLLGKCLASERVLASSLT
jgi:hypothetical protein